jgi:acyl phosphate:glycerol-3-phosphate acyltransferase
MNSLVATVVAVVLAYLLGSIPFAILVSRVAGIADPRTVGSGNPGATNVLRSGNKKAALATLFLDAFKGWLAVWLVSEFGWRFGIGDNGVAAVALAVFIGHLYPVFFGFRGGKGVATAFGVLLAIAWWLGLATLVVWVIVAAISRYASLASIAAAVAAPLIATLVDGFDTIVGALIVMGLLVVYRHRHNVAKLAAGKESRLGSKAKPGARPGTAAKR